MKKIFAFLFLVPLLAFGQTGDAVSGGSVNAPVTQILAGTGITLSPSNGQGVVTINSSGGVSGPGTSTNAALATWNGTAGNALNNSSYLVGGTGGLYASSATGGDKGSGTGNFTNLYVNGVLVGTSGANVSTSGSPAAGYLTYFTSSTGITGTANATLSSAGALGLAGAFTSTAATATTSVTGGALNINSVFAISGSNGNVYSSGIGSFAGGGSFMGTSATNQLSVNYTGGNSASGFYFDAQSVGNWAYMQFNAGPGSLTSQTYYYGNSDTGLAISRNSSGLGTFYSGVSGSGAMGQVLLSAAGGTYTPGISAYYTASGTYTNSAATGSSGTPYSTSSAFEGFLINAPVLASTSGGSAYNTTVTAATFVIGGAPTSSSMTITNPYALLVLSGASMFGGPVVHKQYTVSALPAASSYTYGIVFVSDATASPGTSLGTAPSGSGTYKRAVYSDGSNWLLMLVDRPNLCALAV